MASESMDICGGYVGVSCVDGSCPVANADIYQEYGADVIYNCEDCWLRRDCSTCVHNGTEYCVDEERAARMEVLDE